MFRKEIRKNISIKNRIFNWIAPEIRDLLKRKISHRLTNKKFKKDNFPRYTRSTVKLLGKEIIIPDNASFEFMSKEIFEKKIYKFSTSVKAPYIIDGGANIGLSTIFWKNLFPDAEIVAFEPDPEIFRILKYNIQIFDFLKVKLVKKGLWNESKYISFKVEGADAGLIIEEEDSTRKTIEIETTSLNEYLTREVDFLKLDIEGAEIVVLKDIRPYLGKVKRIFVEYHSFIDKHQSIDEILNILIEAGFRLHINSPGFSSQSPFVHLNTYNGMDMQLNIYGFKESLY